MYSNLSIVYLCNVEIIYNPRAPTGSLFIIAVDGSRIRYFCAKTPTLLKSHHPNSSAQCSPSVSAISSRVLRSLVIQTRRSPAQRSAHSGGGAASLVRAPDVKDMCFNSGVIQWL